jgi:transposase
MSSPSIKPRKAAFPGLPRRDTLIRSAEAKLFFPPTYSSDLNPIEQVFAKLKHFLRKAAAQTVDAVCFGIGEALQLFSPEECASYLANSGYGRT